MIYILIYILANSPAIGGLNRQFHFPSPRLQATAIPTDQVYLTEYRLPAGFLC